MSRCGLVQRSLFSSVFGQIPNNPRDFFRAKFVPLV